MQVAELEDADLSPDLRERVLERLGLTGPPRPDLEGLVFVYGAWCARVPFDNVRKMIALRRGAARLPGAAAADFFSGWLEHGASGTCWPTSNALFVLLRALGFEARRVAGCMRSRDCEPWERHGAP
jgi:N-hydroxyarylamine O-acetyltransferase